MTRSVSGPCSQIPFLKQRSAVSIAWHAAKDMESFAFSSSLLAARFVVGISWRSLLAAPTLTQFVKRTDTGGIAVRGAAIRSTPERSLLAV